MQYFSAQTLKDKKFNWIPIEDYDIPLKAVSKVAFAPLKEDKQSIVFKLSVESEEGPSVRHFAIDTSTIYQEKARSMNRYEGEVEEVEVKQEEHS